MNKITFDEKTKKYGYKLGRLSSDGWRHHREACIFGVERVVSERLVGYEAIIGKPLKKQVRLIFGEGEAEKLECE